MASSSGPGTFAAFIDLRPDSSDASLADQDQDVEKERQRKFLLQIQRTKWLAQRGKLSKSSANTAAGPIGVDLAKSVRMAQFGPEILSDEAYKERIKKDRNAYNTEKHKVLHYYQYYNVHG